jgi:hypothetical protein
MRETLGTQERYAGVLTTYSLRERERERGGRAWSTSAAEEGRVWCNVCVWCVYATCPPKTMKMTMTEGAIAMAASTDGAREPTAMPNAVDAKLSTVRTSTNLARRPGASFSPHSLYMMYLCVDIYLWVCGERGGQGGNEGVWGCVCVMRGQGGDAGRVR